MRDTLGRPQQVSDSWLRDGVFAGLHGAPTQAFYSYAFDANGDLELETDPYGTKTRRHYDDARWLDRVELTPDGGTMLTRTIEQLHAPIQVETTDFDGTHTTFIYDAQGRLASEELQSGSGHVATQSWLYHDNGLLRQQTDRHGLITTLGYDSRGNRTLATLHGVTVAATGTSDAVPANVELRWEYDLSDRVEAEVDGRANATFTEYQAPQGFVERVSRGHIGAGSAGAQTISQVLAFDGFGAPRTIANGLGRATT